MIELQMTETSSNGARQIRLFLVNGTPNGVITAEVMNWTGKAVVAPRARFADLVRREEAGRTGIYILVGPDPERVAGLKAYIGEADSVGKRLRRHEGGDEMDFFDRAAFVVSKDENLTKAHARFLESQLVRLAKEAGTVKLVNVTGPDFTRLPEADRSDMAFFLEQLRIVLPTLGFDLFRPSGSQALAQSNPAMQSPIFELDTVGIRATGREADTGFIVLADSTARKEATPAFPEGYRTLRDQLVRDGKLVDAAESTNYRFATDVVFPSPSAAAAVVMARNASGPREWKQRGTGQTYGTWRSAQLGE
jgi:hypothetical protein